MLLSKEEFNKHISLVIDENYNQNFSLLVRQLKRTRYKWLKNQAWYVNILQINLWKNLDRIQTTARKKKKKII